MTILLLLIMILYTSIPFRFFFWITFPTLRYDCHKLIQTDNTGFIVFNIFDMIQQIKIYIARTQRKFAHMTLDVKVPDQELIQKIGFTIRYQQKRKIKSK
jgi:hypothetical protein